MYTKQTLLDAFCKAQDYENSKAVGETKLQFLSRKQKEWAKSVALNSIRRDEIDKTELLVKEESDGVEL